MTVRFMLDTDTCSFIIRGADSSLRRAVQRHAQSLCVSAVTVAELRFGAAKKDSPRIAEAVSRFLELVDILPWTEDAADRYAALRTRLEATGKPIGNMDMLIAASALAEGCRLVTHNLAHFGRIPDLPVEDWTARPSSPSPRRHPPTTSSH